MIERRFRAMGSDIEMLLDVDPSPRVERVIRSAAERFAGLEQRLSRFLPDSEVSRLNRDGRVLAGTDLLRLVERGIDGRERTGGRFDPTVGDAVIAAGYDRSFELVADRADDLTPSSSAATKGRVVVDRARRAIEVGPGVRIDLGGIAKGYAAERACDVLASLGPCLVSAGGDIAVRGAPRGGGTWTIGADTSSGPVTLALPWGGVATSGLGRRWRRGRQEAHHIIDPATGLPAVGDLSRVTVIARDAVEAEVMATAFFLAGARAAAAEADSLGLPALLVTTDGRTHAAGGLDLSGARRSPRRSAVSSEGPPQGLTHERSLRVSPRGWVAIGSHGGPVAVPSPEKSLPPMSLRGQNR
jgi:thiamine biosynthesis lipoprotein